MGEKLPYFVLSHHLSMSGRVMDSEKKEENCRKTMLFLMVGNAKQVDTNELTTTIFMT